MSSSEPAAGLAALAIFASILLFRTDNGINGAGNARVIFEDAATAHCPAADFLTDDISHADGAGHLEHLLEGDNAVRRRQRGNAVGP